MGAQDLFLNQASVSPSEKQDNFLPGQGNRAAHPVPTPQCHSLLITSSVLLRLGWPSPVSPFAVTQTSLRGMRPKWEDGKQRCGCFLSEAFLASLHSGVEQATFSSRADETTLPDGLPGAPLKCSISNL